MYSHVKADWYCSSADRLPYPVCGWYRNWWLPFRLFVNSKASRLAVSLIAIFIQSIVSFGAQASGRVALVLACEEYENFKDSAVSAEWAGELGQALKERNFDVTVATNRNDAQTRAVLREFSVKAEGADFALIVVGGHLVTYQSQSFFLPQNAKIQRATDLFSRALSLASIADIGGKAKSAALLLLMTVPDIPATVSGVDTRPATGGQQPANVVTVFSSSPRVPVSGVDRVSEQAAEKLLAAAQQEPLTLAALVNGVSAEGVGQVFGKISDINLSAPSPKPEDGSRTELLQAAEAAAKAQAEAERKASLAEERARDAEQRAKLAQEEIKKITDTRSLQSVDDGLTLNERMDAQRRLQSLRLYRGLADANFREQTRVAIKEFQKLSGAPETGYLTRSQFEQLVGPP